MFCMRKLCRGSRCRDWRLCSGMWYGAFYIGTALLAMINRLIAAISDENPAISYDLLPVYDGSVR